MKVLIYSVVVILIDQITKLLIKGFKIPFLNINNRGVNIKSSLKILDDFVQITHVENYGLAFGIDFGRDAKVALTIFTIIAAILILYYLYISRFKDFKVRFSIALILGGACGNLIDRIFYGVLYGYAPLFHGRVVDFIHIDFFDYNLFGKTYESLPIFNFADLSVFIGIMILFYLSFKTKIEQTDEADESSIKPEMASENFQENDQISNPNQIKD